MGSEFLRDFRSLAQKTTRGCIVLERPDMLKALVEKHAELGVMSLELPDPPQMGDFAFVAENISKSFGDRVCFKNLSLSARPGDRIGIIGPNGAGKTTLVRTLLGDLEADSGEIKRSPRLSIGWFRQTQDHIDKQQLAWEFLQNTIRSLEGSPRASEQEARNLAGAFLFTGEEQDKAIGDLSGGERGRLVLASLIASAKNLLVLDEPTNHLDIPSAERLEEALDKFGDIDKSRIGGKGGHGGVLLLISHDRALLDDVCDKLVILDGAGNARVFEGTYREWEAKERAERAAAEIGAVEVELEDLVLAEAHLQLQSHPQFSHLAGEAEVAPHLGVNHARYLLGEAAAATAASHQGAQGTADVQAAVPAEVGILRGDQRLAARLQRSAATQQHRTHRTCAVCRAASAARRRCRPTPPRAFGRVHTKTSTSSPCC